MVSMLRGQGEFLLRLLHHTVSAMEPFQVLSAVDVDGGVLSLLSLDVYDQLLSFVDVEGEVIFLAPLLQGPHLLPVGRLIIVGNQAFFCCIQSNKGDSVVNQSKTNYFTKCYFDYI